MNTRFLAHCFAAALIGFFAFYAIGTALYP